MPCRSRRAIDAFAIILLSASPLIAQGVLHHVPKNALGFAVLNRYESTDGKVAAILQKFNLPYPSPAVFLEAITGIREGLNPNGDFLLAVLPSETGGESLVEYAIWLPVSDYNRMLGALNATRGDTISTITIADEDLIVAQQGQWALIMDPAARDSMQSILDSAQNPPKAIAPWLDWYTQNEIGVAILAPGIEQFLEELSAFKNAQLIRKEVAEFDEIENEDANKKKPAKPTSNSWVPPQVLAWAPQLPEFNTWLTEVAALGIAIRIDDQANIIATARAASKPDKSWLNTPSTQASELPRLTTGNEFVVEGSGHIPQQLMRVITAVYERKSVADLGPGADLDKDTTEEFIQAMITATDHIQSWSIASLPASKVEGIYNNQFLLVSVDSASAFVKNMDQAIQSWNTLNHDIREHARMLVDIDQIKIAGRDAQRYTIDVANMAHMPALPEIRKMMEQFFGPGGKMRMWVVPIDEHSVLLAGATKAQVIYTLSEIARKQPIDWSKPQFASANNLLPEQTDLRVFFNPNSYTEWQHLQNEISNGEVLGGPLTNVIPQCSPIAFGASVNASELRIDIAIPADTIEAYGKREGKSRK